MGVFEIADRIENSPEVFPKGPQPENAAPRRSRLIPMSSTLKVFPKNWLIKDVLSCGEMSVLFAPSGGGKSFVALDMAARVATGMQWFGHNVEKRPVLYVSGEGWTGFQQRMVAWAVEMNIADDFMLFDMLPDAVDLHSDSGRGHDDIDFELSEIEQRRGCKAGLIVLDTLSRMMPDGVDSEPRDMKKFLNQVEKLRLKTGAHIMLVHHTGKDKDRGMRGSSMLRDYADTVFEVKPPDDNGAYMIKIDKQKDGRDGVTFRCDLQSVTFDAIDQNDEKVQIETCVLRQLGVTETSGNLSKSSYAGIAYDALIEALATDGESGTVTPETVNVTTIVTVDSWEDHFKSFVETRIRGGFTSDDARRQAWSRSKKSLLNKGLIKIEGNYAWKV